MFVSKSKRRGRKLLTFSLFLLALAAMLISPAQRKVHAESCSNCYPLYMECLSWCDQLPENENCRLSCMFDYNWCTFYCEP